MKRTINTAKLLFVLIFILPVIAPRKMNPLFTFLLTLAVITAILIEL
jgi:hypothetical protein